MTFGRSALVEVQSPCSLCGKPASGKWGFRLAEQRYVVCDGCKTVSRDEAARLLAERASEPSRRRQGYTWGNKGQRSLGGPRCSASCKLAAGHRGKCYLEEK